MQPHGLAVVLRQFSQRLSQADCLLVALGLAAGVLDQAAKEQGAWMKMIADS